MKPMMNATRSILKTLVAGTALVTANGAFAQVYVEPPPPQPKYNLTALAPAPGLAIALGWHGDRYWDGHRYWEHDEWMQRHPNERDHEFVHREN
jgi:hypothetical protein